MWQGVASFENAGALDDPVGIEAEPLMQMVVGDDAIGNVAARGEHADAGQTAAARSRGWGTFIVHDTKPRSADAARPMRRKRTKEAVYIEPLTSAIATAPFITP